MFTGITEEIGKVWLVRPNRLVIAAGQVLQGMEVGDSIAINGACLTETSFDDNSFSADVMPETLRRTNLGQLQIGDEANLERAVALGGKMGGHLVQGHVDEVGRVNSVTGDAEALIMRIEAPFDIMRYIVTKGFIAVDGVSLTVVAKDASSFRVSLVKYTRKNTSLGHKRIGALVNLEVDIIAKYVEQVSRAQRPEITTEFLKEHGFLVS